nr:hypothetical protein [uncultured Draconibacterium sp.]
MTEIELAKYFVDYLSEGNELYFEVQGVDIVAKCGNILTSVEVKTSLNFKVIEQAKLNLPKFHYCYIAIPRPKRSHFGFEICKMLGIGILTFEDIFAYGAKIREEEKPKLNRKAATHLVILHPEQQKSIPGAKSGETGVMTAFKITVENLERYVRRHPGCSLTTAVKNIDYHYSAYQPARSNLYQHINNGVIKCVKMVNSKLYPIDYEIQKQPQQKVIEL